VYLDPAQSYPVDWCGADKILGRLGEPMQIGPPLLAVASKNLVGQSTGIENQPTDQGRICVYGYGIEKSETKEEHVRGPACQYQPAWSRSA
jgi:hypothetical protein